MKYDVFISYSRKDYVDNNDQIIPSSIITVIKELFDANSITYWLDEQGLSGQEFTSVITQKIRESYIFLFVSSENSNNSIWTRNEIAVASHLHKKIIPFRYDQSFYDDSVMMYIVTLDYIEYYKNPSKALNRLISSVKGYLFEEEQRIVRKREEELRKKELISHQEINRLLDEINQQIHKIELRRKEIEVLSYSGKLDSNLQHEKIALENRLNEYYKKKKDLLGVHENNKLRFWKNFHFNQYNWFLNFICITSLLFSFVSIASFISSIFHIPTTLIAYKEVVTIARICAMNMNPLTVGIMGIISYYILLGRKDAIYWMVILCVQSIISSLYSYWVYHFEDWMMNCTAVVVTIIYLCLLLPALQIPKYGKTAWSLLEQQGKIFMNNKFQKGIVVFLFTWLLISLFFAILDKL